MKKGNRKYSNSMKETKEVSYMRSKAPPSEGFGEAIAPPNLPEREA
jgi:hypothetical protein